MANLAKSSKTSGNITLTPERKTEIISQKCSQMSIELSASDIEEVSQNISNSFSSHRSMVLQVGKAIKEYLVWLHQQESEDAKELVEEINQQVNIHNEVLMQGMRNISEGVSQNNKVWNEGLSNLQKIFQIPTGGVAGGSGNVEKAEV